MQLTHTVIGGVAASMFVTSIATASACLFTDNTELHITAHGLLDETNSATWTGATGDNHVNVYAPSYTDDNGEWVQLALGELILTDDQQSTMLEFDARLYDDPNHDDTSSTAVWSHGLVEFIVAVDATLTIALSEWGAGWHTADDHYFNVAQHFADDSPVQTWNCFQRGIDFDGQWATDVSVGDTITVSMSMMVESWDSYGQWNSA